MTEENRTNTGLNNDSKTSNRKLEHIKICIDEDIETDISTGFEDILFVHQALVNFDYDEIDTSCEFLGRKFGFPLLIDAITGGHPASERMNKELAKVAEKFNLPLCLGSQRAAIEKPDLAYTYSAARKAAPTAWIAGNLGFAQLARGYGLKEAQAAVEMIEANALFIHLNPLQETLQPEGDLKFKGAFKTLETIIKDLGVPVLIKETGAGISKEVAKKFAEIGIKGINISGAGGTSWSAVENYRADVIKDEVLSLTSNTFWDWGIPTACSLIETLEMLQNSNIPVISSGGIRTGIEIAKSITLGARMAGSALPFVQSAYEKDAKTLEIIVNSFLREFKTSMLLTGCKKISDLGQVPLVILGDTAEWLKQRGINTSKYNRQ